MNNNTAENSNEMEDVIIDTPGESQAPEIIQPESEKAQHPAENKKTLDEIIDELPGNFPEANPIVKCEVFPQIIEMDAGMQDFYIERLRKKMSVGKQTIKEAIKAFKQEMATAAIEPGDNNLSETEEEIDPEIIEQAEKLALNPKVFNERINMVNSLGIINERRNIGVLGMTIDSRLNPMGIKGANVMATKITGLKGSGKTAALMAVKELYSKDCYHYLNSGSAKSIYNMGKDALEHKALILGEGFAFQGNNSNDSDFTHSVRCLVSEGFLTYQYTGYDADGKKITRYQTINGPTPLITTSIYGKLEEQLDDRMFSIHPNITSKQTSDVLSIEAEIASGLIKAVDKKEIQIWRAFHDSLEVLDVVIPFATDIYLFLVQGGDLPVPARRAFNRVLNSIRTISLLHQKQREKDDKGRVIAEIRDYALAYQLIDDAFRESLGGGKYSDQRLRVVDKKGPILPKNLAKLENVSGAAITSWSKNWLDNGVLIWCDDQSVKIKAKELDKMKHSGKAYLKVVGVNRLPNVYELTGDPDWVVGGELYQFYNLELDSGHDLLDDDVYDEEEFNTSEESEEVENSRNEDEIVDPVNVLNHKSNEEVKKIIQESIRKQREEYVSDDVEIQELSEEFGDILKPYVPEYFEESIEVNNHRGGLLNLFQD